MKHKGIIKVLGVYFAFGKWFGNCFSPAVVLTHSLANKPYVSKVDGKMNYPAKALLTLRFKGQETIIYWRGALRIDWNSAHLARWFGKSYEAPHGTCWQWRTHHDI